jgi:hypothetical protein
MPGEHFRSPSPFWRRAFLMSAAVLLSSGLRYLTSEPLILTVFGGFGSPSRRSAISTSFLIPCDRKNDELTHLSRMSSLPVDPHRSSSLKSAEVIALCPRTT